MYVNNQYFRELEIDRPPFYRIYFFRINHKIFNVQSPLTDNRPTLHALAPLHALTAPGALLSIAILWDDGWPGIAVAGHHTVIGTADPGSTPDQGAQEGLEEVLASFRGDWKYLVKSTGMHVSSTK